MDERRKNPSRKRAAQPDLVYQVRWNDDRRTFDVYRGEEKTGAFARDKATAIGLAIRAAQQEESTLKVAVSSVLNNRTIVEWSR